MIKDECILFTSNCHNTGYNDKIIKAIVIIVIAIVKR